MSHTDHSWSLFVKQIARAVTFAFGQKVCGFDLLRSEKGPFVCDVNGWSFVKSSYKYYEDAAEILRMAILHRLAPHKVSLHHRIHLARMADCPTSPQMQMTRDNTSFDDLDDLSNKSQHFDEKISRLDDWLGASVLDGDDVRNWEELRCVLMVARHGDRTPKQKMKMVVCEVHCVADAPDSDDRLHLGILFATL